jgi:uncharacterized Zn finger protein
MRSATCPDKEIPCKHIAAVILSTAKIFDYDPFLILKLRGMERDELLLKIEQKRFPNLEIQNNINDIDKDIETIKVEDVGNNEFFFSDYNEVKVPVFNISELNHPDSVLKRIDTPPEISKDKDFMETITKIYFIASKFAYNLINKSEEKEKEQGEETE